METSGSESSVSSSRPVWDAKAVMQARDYVVDDDTLATLSRPLRDKGYVYENPWPTWAAIGFTDFTKHFFKGGKGMASVPSKELLEQELPVLDPDWNKLNRPDPKDMQVFSERCSPVSFAGPKRYRKTPMKLTELPPVDFVVISHSHYDHLDISVVTALGDHTCWFVPEGLKKWFASHGVLNVVELDWWQRATVKDSCFITCLPTQHWSNRGLFDKNETLWGSFSIKSVISGRTAYFGGDTGYCGAFKEIGEHVGPFDLAIIPIGAYCPRELMRYAHVEPAESVKIHQDIRSKFSIGCHFGTFILTSENCIEPIYKLAQEILDAQLPANSFITIKIGQTFTVVSEDIKKEEKTSGNNSKKVKEEGKVETKLDIEMTSSD